MNSRNSRTPVESSPSRDGDNPYRSPETPSNELIIADKSSRSWGIIFGNVILIPIYLVVLTASVAELIAVDDVTAREAIDYWRHAFASLTFLGFCGATLFLSTRRSALANSCFILSTLLLVIMIYPGLNVLWNAVVRFAH